MYSLLNAASWTEFIENMSGLETSQRELLGQVFNIISIVLWVVLAIVGAIGSIYAIYLGVQLARADEQGKRDDAKKHLITTVIAVGVTVALILVFNIFLPMILDAFKVGQSVTSGGGGNQGEDPNQGGEAGAMITLFSNFANMIKCRF